MKKTFLYAASAVAATLLTPASLLASFGGMNQGVESGGGSSSIMSLGGMDTGVGGSSSSTSSQSGTGALSGGSSAGGVDSYYLGTGMNTNEMRVLTAINSDTTEIAGYTGNMDKNVANMRQVMSARQQLIVAVAKMNLLVTQGRVIQQDPLGDGEINSMENAVSSVFDAGGVAAGSLPGAQGYSGSGYGSGQSFNPGEVGRVGGINGVLGTSGSSGGIVGSVGNIAQGNASSGDIIGVVQGVLSMFGSNVSDLSFNGSSFSGMNSQNIDNIMGHMGRVISLDRQVPQTVQAVPYYYKDRIIGSATAVSNDGQTLNLDVPKKIADGFYLRKEAPYDGAYVKMVERGNGGSNMQFFAAISEGDVVTYDPTSGTAPQGYGFKTSVNMNDALSSGAYGAVASYNARMGGGANPYADFARTIAPVLGDATKGQEPNTVVAISQNTIEAGAEAAPVKLTGFGKVADARNSKEKIRFIAALKPFAQPSAAEYFSDYQAASAIEDIVAVFAPPEREGGELMSKIDASDGRIKQNSSLIIMNQLMLGYSKEVLQASVNLRNELQRIAGGSASLRWIPEAGRFVLTEDAAGFIPVSQPGGSTVGGSLVETVTGAGSSFGGTGAVGSIVEQFTGPSQGSPSSGSGLQMDENNAIESIMMMIQNCDNMALVLQRQIADYAIEIERLLNDRNSELRSRSDIWTEARTANEKSIDGRLRAAAMAGR